MGIRPKSMCAASMLRVCLLAGAVVVVSACARPGPTPEAPPPEPVAEDLKAVCRVYAEAEWTAPADAKSALFSLHLALKAVAPGPTTAAFFSSLHKLPPGEQKSALRAFGDKHGVPWEECEPVWRDQRDRLLVDDGWDDASPPFTASERETAALVRMVRESSKGDALWEVKREMDAAREVERYAFVHELDGALERDVRALQGPACEHIRKRREEAPPWPLDSLNAALRDSSFAIREERMCDVEIATKLPRQLRARHHEGQVGGSNDVR